MFTAPLTTHAAYVCDVQLPNQGKGKETDIRNTVYKRAAADLVGVERGGH